MSTPTDMIYCKIETILTSMSDPSPGSQYYSFAGKMVITDQTPSGDAKTPYFTIEAGNNLVISVPRGTPLRVQYFVTSGKLASGPYILNGIYFTETPEEDKSGNKGFPLVTISRETAADSSVVTGEYTFKIEPDTMNVVDANDYTGYYRYVLVIQDVATGVVGTFDPGYDNES